MKEIEQIVNKVALEEYPIDNQKDVDGDCRALRTNMSPVSETFRRMGVLRKCPPARAGLRAKTSATSGGHAALAKAVRSRLHQRPVVDET